MLHSSQARKKLKLRLPLLDGNQLTFETKGRIEHGSIMEFPDKGMPIKGGPRCGKLFVQFQFTDERRGYSSSSYSSSSSSSSSSSRPSSSHTSSSGGGRTGYGSRYRSM